MSWLFRVTVRGVRAAAVMCCLTTCCLIPACGDTKSEAHQASVPTSSTPKTKVASGAAAPPSAKKLERPAPPAPVTVARVARTDGAPGEGGAVFAPGQRLDSGAVLTLGPAQTIEIDIALSGRLDVRGVALFRTGLDAQAQVLAARGLFTVKMPPTGDGKLLAMRFATPRVSLILRPGTVAVVAVAMSHDVLVHVLSGQAEVAPATLPVDPAPDTEKINAGAAKRFDARGVASLKAGEDLEAALSQAAAFLKAKSSSRAHNVVATELEHTAVESVLTAFEEEARRGREIAEQQRTVIAAGDQAEGRARQRDLAQHGQRLFRIRRTLLTVWERAQLVELSATPAAQVGIQQAHHELRARLTPVLPR